ncbi:hypothetical protein ACIQ7Q_17675 [Streptomyces sp. NPDC096176]|uniref:hypothetical protein n=1 Tax=Streptomyces sp. NPDC096176 TaxID=3366079 RepID=UPI0038261B1E
MSLDHQILAELSKILGCTVLLGVCVEDAFVYTDHAAARQRPGRGDVPAPGAGRCGAGGRGSAILRRAPRVRSRRLAFNRGVTFADAFAVATPLLASDGSPIAAIGAAVDPAEGDRLDDVCEEFKKAVAVLGPDHGLNRA